MTSAKVFFIGTSVLLIIAGSTQLPAQTSANPDFSVIGDLRVNQAGELSTSGLELAIQGYVNPFARADVFLHKHGGHEPIELEEAVLTIERGLPLGLGLRSGKFRPDLGKINKEHMHTFATIEAPGAVQGLLGEELWSGTGLELNALAPLPWYSKLTMGVFANGIEPHHHHEEEGADTSEVDEHAHEEEESHPALNFRLSHFLDLTDVAHLELGVSAYLSDADEGPRNIAGVDFKFRRRPDRYRSLTWQGEYFYINIGGDEPAHAAYSWLNLQVNQVWNGGLMADYSSDIDEESYWSAGLFLGFSPVEESSVLRLRLLRSVHGDEEAEYGAIAQLIWSLGPHKPHVF